MSHRVEFVTSKYFPVAALTNIEEAQVLLFACMIQLFAWKSVYGVVVGGGVVVVSGAIVKLSETLTCPHAPVAVKSHSYVPDQPSFVRASHVLV